MKNLRWMFAILIAGTVLFSACSSDDDPKEENKLSDLTAEQHKVNLEDEGVAFIQNMNAVASLEIYDVIEQFFQLMDQANAGQPVYAPLKSTLDKVAALRNQPETTINLKALNQEGNFSFSQGFNEEAGIYTWDAGTNTWTKKADSKQITYIFILENQQTATISLTNFDYKVANNLDIELLKSIKLSVKMGETELCAFTFTGEYHDNDTPKYLEELFTLEGFSLKGTFDLTDKTHLKTNGEFKYDETIILANGFELEGDVDYDAIKAEMEGSENAEGFPMDQKIVEKTNAYFQVGNIKADALFNVDAMIQAMKNVPEAEQTEEKLVALLNEHVKTYIRYADSKEVIAYGEFYLGETTDWEWDSNLQEYVEVPDTEMKMRMILSDKTAIDAGFFNNGFGKMIDEINDLIAAMNQYYGMELEGIQ